MTATVTTDAGAGTPARGTSRGSGGARRGVPRIPDRIRRGGLPYLLLLPAVLLELLIHLIPMIVGIVMSFRQLTQFFISNWGAAPWTGLENYRIAVDFDAPIGEALLHSFFVTCVFTFSAVGLAWLFGVTAAIMLQDSIYALIIVSVWKGWPFAFLMLMAALQNIPRELYEAAAIDGAGVWQQIRRITMPSLRPVNQVLVLVLFLWTFNDFNTPYVLFGKAAPASADLISIHIYQSSFVTWNFGTGSAMSVLLMLFLLVVTAVYLFLTSRGRKGSHA
ncbi:carbohydrate ABC transporter permease [Streptomyces sp. NPDC060030]|uniref:carbohydrate ABC transporter permease n=1 Tax=Streptomyces sp. NPDC060030 TaxID=3347042 RepID=UPI0036B3BD4D